MNVFDSLNDENDRRERSALTRRVIEAATEATRSNDPDAWEPVMDMLYRATVILPFVDDEDEDDGGERDEDEENVPVVANDEGEHLLPIFTDEEELDQWRPGGGRYTLVETPELLKLAVQEGFTGVVVNPAGSVPIELGAENIQDDDDSL